MKAYQLANILVRYPAKWEVEKEGNLVSFYDAKDGLGALQVSHFIVDNPESIELGKELEEYIDNLPLEAKITTMDKYAYSSFTDEDSIFWEYWLFMKENTLFMFTYNCSEEDIGKEKAIVDSILGSVLTT